MAETAGNALPWQADYAVPFELVDGCLLGQPGTEKEFQPAWQAYKYLLRGKMYALVGTNDQIKRPILTLKLDPAYSEMLRREYEDIVPGYYMNKVHWSTVYLDSNVPHKVVTDAILMSHGTLLATFGKKAQQEIREHCQ
ncbi:MAG: MmcQ/YjbR family DNA-binding protein [Gordonibacter sp.]|uniref:MmcQ/YjbR family DNA-binding protein n=2 Tax=Gordonibacter sp. TaxID=1968902 RepID=UPI002FC761AB